MPPEDYYATHRTQICVEAVYLFVLFIAAVTLLLLTHCGVFTSDEATKTCFIAYFGGLLGAWSFTTKWFYRSVARIGHNPSQILTSTGVPFSYSTDRRHDDDESWNPKRLYWRIFTPFVASMFAFAFVLTFWSDFFFVQLRIESEKVAFGITYFLGYFSDALISKVATKIDHLI